MNNTLVQDSRNCMHLGDFIEAPGLGYAAEANMQLIESAPLLLMALEKAIPILAAHARMVGGEGSLTWDLAMSAVKAATIRLDDDRDPGAPG
jgi:hypothetical protein